jgi:UDP-N-acetylglucosamine--N-acetylmuramyl-(pentapeptide) pyrophosphoryl-undecaprenol N-acetylglucosamine transferase
VRVVISGGGTGGGIYPALSVVDELVDDPRWETALEDILWVGQSGGLEERVMARRGIRFRPLPTGPLRGMSPWRAAAGLGRMAQGAVRGRRLLGEFGADVVLATGGYVSAPMLAAAWRRCPSLIYLPDMTPGLAVRYLSPLATRVAVSFDRVLAHFSPGKAFVSGYPVRRALVAADRRGARAQLGFTDDASVVLVMGGSRGARAINAALAAGLPDLLAGATVIHVSGQADHDWLCRRRGELPVALRERYRLYAYLYDEMPQALAAADVAVARAGASTLAEFPAVGLPAVLVPYPHSGAHQQPNADYMAERGAAVVLPEADVERLVPTVLGLLGDGARREAMAIASRALARPQAAETLAAALWDLARAGAAGEG